MKFSHEFHRLNRVEQRPLSSLTTMRIGGMATVVTLESRSSLTELLSGPIRLLGKGANLLVSDDPIEQCVVQLGEAFSGCSIGETRGGLAVIEAGAGLDLAELISRCCHAGLCGPEGLAGVPATIGGALRMNAGTSTCWMLDWVSSVEVVLPGEIEARYVDRGSLNASYRNCGLPQGTIFLGCQLTLGTGDPTQLRAQASRLKKAKAASQPLALASAGCVFKNPSQQLPAGKLIDEMGLKGTRVGGAMISPVHANFIVNPEREARAQDVCTLIRIIRERAWKERGIELTMEVEAWNCPADITAHPRELSGAAL